VQVLRFRCRNPEDFGTRRRLFHNITDFDALVDGRIVDNCLQAELDELTIRPSGFVGGVLNITGLSQRIAARVRGGLNEELREDLSCLDLPQAMQLIDTHLRSGGFRDFGDGVLGFVVEGTIDVRAGNMVALISLLARQGGLRR
jgi:hypothetical protein